MPGFSCGRPGEPGGVGLGAFGGLGRRRRQRQLEDSERQVPGTPWGTALVRRTPQGAARPLTQPCFPGSRPAGEEEAGGPERPGDV